MLKHVTGGMALMLVAAAMPATAYAMSTTVNCSQGQKIAAALNAGFDDIKVRGICTERVEIRVDDVAIEGKPGAKVIGQLFVNGARRVTIKNLAVEGTAPTPSGAGILLDRGASAVLDHVTVRNAEDGVDATGNSYVEILNGSLFENNSAEGVFIADGSTGRVTDSTSRNNDATGILVQREAFAILTGNTVQSNQGGEVLVIENSNARLNAGNTLLTTVDGNVPLRISDDGSARLRGGGNTLTNSAGGAAIALGRGAGLRQDGGHDTLNGGLSMSSASHALLGDAEINGDVNIDDHSIVTLQQKPNTTLNGNIGLSRDSGLSLEGPVIINGSIDCGDDESSFFSTEGLPANCTGF